MQRHLHRLLEWIRGAGWAATVVTTAGGRVSDCDAEFVELPGTTPGRYGRRWWASTRQFVRCCDLGAWDVVVSEDGGAWAVVDEFREHGPALPIVMVRHGTALQNMRTQLRQPSPRSLIRAAAAARDMWRHARRLAPYVDIMVCVSPNIAREVRLESSAPLRDVRTVPLGTDLSLFKPCLSPGPARRQLGLRPDVPTLLAVGRDDPQKRLSFALDVFEALTAAGGEFQLFVAAAHPRSRTVRQFETVQRKYPSRIVLIKNVPNRMLQVPYQAASVALFPSVAPEGNPTTVMEALASGLPVLVAKNQTLQDHPLVNEQPAWVVDSDLPSVWSERVQALMPTGPSDPNAQAARALAERHFDVRTTQRLTLQALSDAVSTFAREAG